jgi:hypothetical protein
MRDWNEDDMEEDDEYLDEDQNVIELENKIK